MSDESKPAERSYTEKRQFHIQSCLGRGGFGEVYLAQMTSAGGVQTDVAVKVLHQNLDPRSQSVQRLRDEGRLLGVLNHPSILRVADLVLLQGRVALVTEYVDGEDLEQSLEAGDRISVRGLVEVVGRVADALHAAYTRPSPDGGTLQLVHRDVKPSNIRLGKHGDVKLLDFGIAKATNTKREAKTQANATIGSLLYMSPERLEGSGTGPEGDVFALGAVLYEGLSGERFFGYIEVKAQYGLAYVEEKFNEFLRARMNKIEGAPDEIIELCEQMMTYDPKKRPTAAEVARRCEELSDEIPGQTLRRWCRDHDWAVAQAVEGMLDGKIITESTFTISRQTTDTMALSMFDEGTDEAASEAVASAKAAAGLVPAAELPRERTAETLLRDNTTQATVGGGGFSGKQLFMGAAALVTLGVVLSVSVIGTGALAVLSLNTEGEVTGPIDDGVAGVDDPIVEPADVPPVPDPGTTAVTAPEDAPEDGTAEVTEAGGAVDGADAAPEEAAPPTPAPAPDAGTADPVPEPAPEPKVIRVTPPPPTPTPTPAPPPPKPTAAGGTVDVSGSAMVELRGGGKTFPPGAVPAGKYEVWADFGSGLVSAGEVNVFEGQTATLKCSRLAQVCTER